MHESSYCWVHHHGVDRLKRRPPFHATANNRGERLWRL